MQISPTFAKREDLSAHLKWRYTIQESIEKSANVRWFYRRYFFLPQWIKTTVEALSFGLAVIPLVILYFCSHIGKTTVSDEEEEWGDGIAFVLFAVILGSALYFYYPLGLALVFMIGQFAVLTWFFNVMLDYEIRLRKWRFG